MAVAVGVAVPASVAVHVHGNATVEVIGWYGPGLPSRNCPLKSTHQTSLAAVA